MSFVASCHHRVLQCFLYHGNAGHGKSEKAVSLSEFQEAVRSRHLSGTAPAEIDASQNLRSDIAA